MYVHATLPCTLPALPFSRRRLMGRPPEPPHTAATSAPQPRQETVAPLVIDDSASPLLSQPPEVFPALASGAVLLEPARLEEKAVHAEDASGSGGSMLAGQKPPQKVWKRTVCSYTSTAASRTTYTYVHIPV